MALNAQILLSILAHESSSGDISQTLRATPATYALALADGTGANQAQVVWSDARTLAGASETINASSLTDDRGSISLTALKAVYVKNSSTATLTFTPASAAAFGGTQHVRAGGAALAVASDATGMAAGNLVVAGGAGQTYDIILIGEGTVT
jgi:hypothetical protein